MKDNGTCHSFTLLISFSCHPSEKVDSHTVFGMDPV